jgi:ribosomal protein L29
MKYQDIANKPVEALQKDLAELREKFNDMKVKSRMGQVKNTNELKSIRKDIARIMTALTVLTTKS